MYPPPNKWGTLFNIRQDVTSRAAYKHNRHSTSPSYLSSSWLGPEGLNSMLGPSKQEIAQKRVRRSKAFRPGARPIWGSDGKPCATLRIVPRSGACRVDTATRLSVDFFGQEGCIQGCSCAPANWTAFPEGLDTSFSFFLSLLLRHSSQKP